MHRRRQLVVAVASAALAISACGGPEASPSSRGGDLEGTLVVLAAASLRDAFGEVAEAFEAQNNGLDVQVSTDGSSRVAAAIVGGAPGDVFAAADSASLQTVVAAGLAVGPGTVFATNRLEIVVATGNPRGITGLSDLIAPNLVLSLCADGVPCGSYTRRAFERAGLSVPAAGGEASVAGVLTRVRLGEADAGIVYATDVRGATEVEGVELGDREQVLVSYPAVVLADALQPDAAAAFVAFLLGEDAQGIFAGRGFGPP